MKLSGISAKVIIRETNNHIIHWEGEKLTKSDAFEISGIKNVHWLGEFDEILSKILKEVDHVYINTNEHYRQNVETQTREDRFIKWCKNYMSLARYPRGTHPVQRHIYTLAQFVQ